MDSYSHAACLVAPKSIISYPQVTITTLHHPQIAYIYEGVLPGRVFLSWAGRAVKK